MKLRLQSLFDKLGSRKFQVLLLSSALFLARPEQFTGDNLVWVFAVYMGTNVLQKFMEFKKP